MYATFFIQHIVHSDSVTNCPNWIKPIKPSQAVQQRRRRNIFQRGQSPRGKSHFSWFFPCVKCFFPVENAHIGRQQKKYQWFWKVKSTPFTSLSPSNFNFPPSLFRFSFLSSPFSLFPCLSFPSRSAEISRWEVSGGTLPPRLLRHCCTVNH